jgi:hypothetical protein
VAPSGDFSGIHDPTFKYDHSYEGLFKSDLAVSATTAAILYSIQFVYFSKNETISVHSDPIILNHIAKIECGSQRYLKENDNIITGCIPGDCFFEMTDIGGKIEKISISMSYRSSKENRELVARRQGVCVLTTLAVASGNVGIWNRNLDDEILINSGSIGPEWFVKPGSLFEKCVLTLKGKRHDR